jgi:hypothetical protein
VPDQATDAQTSTAATDAAPELQAITALLEAAAASFSKRGVDARGGPYKKADIFIIVKKLIWELLFTVKFLIFKLGLGRWQ